MSIAHGRFEGAVVPFRRRNHRIVSLARARETVYVRVHRDRGGERDVDCLANRLRGLLLLLDARCEGTDAAPKRRPTDADSWWDWYAIPLTAQNDPASIYRRLASRGAEWFDGPYWGRGRECVPCGAGEVRPGSRPAALRRAAFKAIADKGNPSLLLTALFGDSSGAAYGRIAPQVIACDVDGKTEAMAESIPPDWEWSIDDWLQLNSDWPDFHRVYRAVADLVAARWDHAQDGLTLTCADHSGAMMALASQGKDVPCAACAALFAALEPGVILNRWIKERVEGKSKPSGPAPAPLDVPESTTAAEAFRRRAVAKEARRLDAIEAKAQAAALRLTAYW